MPYVSENYLFVFLHFLNPLGNVFKTNRSVSCRMCWR